MVYKGCDIGSAKPTKAILEEFPHEMIDIVSPSEIFTVSDFCTLSKTIIEKSHKADKLPLFVGGSMMYFKSLLDGIHNLPDRDNNFREELEKLKLKNKPYFLYKLLEKKDPEYAQGIDKNDEIRIIRALEVIKRIEVIKGPAARIFGQNAFTGAINIVTKSNADLKNNIGFQLGSYNQQHITGTLGTKFEKSSLIGHASINSSEGYRYNTDFENQNYFLKSSFKTKSNPIDMMATFSERKFGGNQFYSINAREQYEETQSSLVSISTTKYIGNVKIRPQVYWKRNQDMYLYIRANPSVYRNLHISNIDQNNSSNLNQRYVVLFSIEINKIILCVIMICDMTL